MFGPVVTKLKRGPRKGGTRYVVWFENKLESGKILTREFERRRDARRFAAQVRR